VSISLPLRCRCGHVHGVASDVAPHTGFRFVCYCRDCQGFARFLKRPDVLDAAGGTDIFHMPAGRMRLEAGTDAVRCLKFSSTVFRWYADCCRTPIANSAGPRFPVVGLIHSFMGSDAEGLDRDTMLGAPLCRLFEHSATGPLPPNPPPPPSFRIHARRAPKLLGWWLHGLGRPNPFFEVRTNAPISEPRILMPGERAVLNGLP
jgi:Family of unknown function (DUF6151)